MHTNQTYNSLSIADVSKINLPKSVEPYVAKYNWTDTLWNAVGLPAFNSHFSVSGDQLYFECGEDGQTKIRQLDFTGEVLASCVITPDDCDSVFVLTMQLVFCNGKLCGSRSEEFSTQPREQYDRGLKEFYAAQEKNFKTYQSWWFKYLYLPYFTIVKWLITILVFVVEFSLKCAVSVANKITPIKF